MVCVFVCVCVCVCVCMYVCVCVWSVVFMSYAVKIKPIKQTLSTQRTNLQMFMFGAHTAPEYTTAQQMSANHRAACRQ